MVQAMSLFNQLLQHFPSLEFTGLVKKHSAERAAKGFSCRTQLVAMLFCQLAHADSLRDICNGLACCLGKLVHLGYPSDEPLWRVRAGLPDIGMDGNWISGLPEPSCAAAVHRAV